MAEAVGAFNWVAPLINSSLTFVAGAFVLARYHWNRLRQSVFLGVALIFLGLTYFMEFGYKVGLIAATVVPFLLENSFLSIAMVLLYCGCALFFTRRKLYTTFLASLLLVVQEITIVYFYLIANDQFPVISINIIFFGIPIAVFAGSSFFLDYLSSKRRASLLIAVSSWAYSGLGPLFYLVNLTPYELVFHLLSALTIVVMFVGFTMLAGSKSESMAR
ncbi:MAG: hypothetical protein WED04_12160 [Promethearchaeati archaeon SRVP18_Atabeyarchaeia-1]